MSRVQYGNVRYTVNNNNYLVAIMQVTYKRKAPRGPGELPSQTGLSPVVTNGALGQSQPNC